ncbi:MAG TPA: DNA primase [Bryobacteraceae bacterium]|nr:DNA primase [Bryobacteraceae bacterium]
MDFAEQVKGSVDIVSVVGEHVRLKRSGSYRYTGLCPFHNEKTPSFTVNTAHQFYKCFGCGAGGDVFNFVMEIEGLSFYEALKSLAERHGIPMPKRSQYADEDTRQRGALYQMHEIAQEHFRANLHSPAGEAARAYLAKRGVAPETAEQFGLGYADRGGRSLLRLFEQRQFPAALIEQSGLVRKRDDGSAYEIFRNRLMFPIHDRSGRIIAFGGRALAPDDQPKYLNSPETPIYKKSHVLYNLHRAKEGMRKENRVILVEGYMDAIGVTAAGFTAVVATCGTALTAQHVQSIRQLTPNIVVNFDPDTAGANAAEKSIDLLLAEGMQVRILALDGGLDPDEYCKERGASAYAERLDGAQGYFHWLADRARSKYDIRTTEGQVSVLKALMPAVQRISDRMERLVVAGELASYIGVDRGMVLESFKKAVAERQESRFVQPQANLRLHDERILLNALVARTEETAALVEELKGMAILSTLASRRIFQAISAIVDGGGAPTFDAVHARLTEDDRNLFAGAVLNEDLELGPEVVARAMESLRRADREYRCADLRRQIREAERAGRLEDALRLAGELNRLGVRGRA